MSSLPSEQINSLSFSPSNNFRLNFIKAISGLFDSSLQHLKQLYKIDSEKAQLLILSLINNPELITTGFTIQHVLNHFKRESIQNTYSTLEWLVKHDYLRLEKYPHHGYKKFKSRWFFTDKSVILFNEHINYLNENTSGLSFSDYDFPLNDGSDLLQLRRSLNYSQDQLAKFIGVSHDSISKKELNQRPITPRDKLFLSMIV